MEINEALSQLDHGNDDQWTNDGLPQIAVIKQITGASKVTRKMITDAAPDFKRIVPNASTGEQNTASPSQTDAQESSENEPQAVTTAVASGEPVKDVKSRYDALSEQILEMQTERNLLDEEIAKLTKEQQRLQPWVKPEGYDADEDQANRMHYIHQQNKMRMAQALGVQLSELTDDKPEKTPLDKHLQNRT